MAGQAKKLAQSLKGVQRVEDATAMEELATSMLTASAVLNESNRSPKDKATRARGAPERQGRT